MTGLKRQAATASAHSIAIADARALAIARAFEEKLALVTRGVRLLPSLTARNAAT